jgi:hypothetical protein
VPGQQLLGTDRELTPHKNAFPLIDLMAFEFGQFYVIFKVKNGDRCTDCTITPQKQSNYSVPKTVD